MTRPLALALLVLAIGACTAPLVRVEYTPEQVTVAERRGMVVAEDGTAAAIGAKVLRDGGNAVDAIVATAFAMSVTYPQAAGLGGGGFAVVSMPGKAPVAIDFREIAPAAASRDMFLDPDGKVDRKKSLASHLAAGVPGVVAGLHALHEKYGTLPWARLVAPAVKLAEEGFEIPEGLAADLNTHRDRLKRDWVAKQVLVRGTRRWRAGDVLIQEDLAKTLGEIRDQGPSGFYTGKVAETIAADFGRRGGLITVGDLAGYRPEWRIPERFNWRGHEVVTMPLPSSGGIVLREILTVLDHAGGAAAVPGSADRLHLFVEAERRAFADRNASLGDPSEVPDEVLARLRSPDYLQARAATIDPKRATPSKHVAPGEGSAPIESPETTNLVVVDKAGGAVTLTTTLNSSFGAHRMVPGTGILLNNEMDDFAAKPGEPNQFGLRQGERNAVRPGNRPLSSMSPTLVMRDGRVVLALGSPGGPRILTSVALVVLRHVGDTIPLDRAVFSPRIHHQHLPDAVFWERATFVWLVDQDPPPLEFGLAEVRALESFGHTLKARRDPIGRVTAIAVDPATGEVMGVADPRSYGSAVSE